MNKYKESHSQITELCLNEQGSDKSNWINKFNNRKINFQVNEQQKYVWLQIINSYNGMLKLFHQ